MTQLLTILNYVRWAKIVNLFAKLNFISIEFSCRLVYDAREGLAKAKI